MGGVGFGPDGGRATQSYLVSASDLADTLLDAVGTVATATTDGRIKRTLPRAHGKFPWLFVARITDVRGRGTSTEVAGDETLTAPPVTAYGSWPQYVFTLEFTPRPYALLPDDRVSLAGAQWTNDSNTVTDIVYADEWGRFVEYLDTPVSEVLTGQQGVGYQFVTGSTAAPHGTTFPGGPQLRIARREVVLRWHDVPYRYLTSSNSHLARYAGRINQTAFLTYAAGSLLFKGARLVKRNPPPFPQTARVPGLDMVSFSYEQLATFDLEFDYVQRTGTDLPTPAHGNYIAAGHNLMPRFTDALFYYVTNSAGRPPFLSAPFELLFTDPDI